MNQLRKWISIIENRNTLPLWKDSTLTTVEGQRASIIGVMNPLKFQQKI